MECGINLAELLAGMATLDVFEVATIVYCLGQGMSKTLLARRFKKSVSWMYSLAKRDLSTVFPNEESQVWFETGVTAQQMLTDFREGLRQSQIEDPCSDVANAFCEASRIRRAEQKEQK